MASIGYKFRRILAWLKGMVLWLLDQITSIQAPNRNMQVSQLATD